jgi:flavin-dependent dehydrogenase
MKTDYDAIVVGGGPAGSTVAIRLAEAGWSVALVEQKEFPRRKVCGECIAATNLDLLDALGPDDCRDEFHGVSFCSFNLQCLHPCILRA